MPLPQGPRHPLCPYCRYDLVATVEAEGRVCPECGEGFELHELIRERRPGDWSESVGIRRLLVGITLRAIPATAIWCGWLLLVNSIGTSGGLLLGLITLLANLVIGVVIGKLMWRNIREASGFDGLFPACVVCGSIWVMMALCGAIIGRFTALGTPQIAYALVSAGLAAAVSIIPSAIFDD